MSTPKPRIRPKAESNRPHGEPPPRDPPAYPELDPPVFANFDPGMERKAAEGVVFNEDDCLR